MKLIFLIPFFLVGSIGLARSEKRIVLGGGTQALFAARLSFPDKIKRPLPVIILLGGLKTGERSIDLLHPKTEVIYATLEYPYQKTVDKSLFNKLKEIPTLKTALHKVNEGMDLLITHLGSEEIVDKTKMIVAGASLGSPFAITAAARNPNISGLIIIHGFAKEELVIKQQLLLEWGDSFLAKVAATWAGFFLWEYLDYSSSENEISKLSTHQKVLLIQAENDKYVPKEASEALTAALKLTSAKSTILTTQEGHVRPNKKELLEKLINLCESWLKQEGFLKPHEP